MIGKCVILAADVLTMLEETSDLVWDAVVAEDAIPSQRLTVMGLALVDQYAGAAVRCFEIGLRYAGLALDRCFYEAMVHTLEWMTDLKLASSHWGALPAFGTSEEFRRAGKDQAKMPPAVVRDRDKYKTEHPEAFEVKLMQFDEARMIMQKCFGLTEAQLLSDKSTHVDVPSLAIHSRPLVAEDFFEMHEEGLDRRERSVWLSADARVLEIVRLLLLLSNKVRDQFNLPSIPEGLWQRLDQQRMQFASEGT
ncbi:MAG: hypothetical protein WBX26_07560 [Candidatus Cybelea sp.]